MNKTLKDGWHLTNLQHLSEVVQCLQCELSNPKFLLFARVNEWTAYDNPSDGGRYCHLAVVSPYERLADEPFGKESGWTYVGTLDDEPPEICRRLKSNFPEYFLGDTYEFLIGYWFVGFFDGQPAGFRVSTPTTHEDLADNVREAFREVIAEEWELLLGRKGAALAAHVQVLPLSLERGGARSAA